MICSKLIGLSTFVWGSLIIPIVPLAVLNDQYLAHVYLGCLLISLMVDSPWSMKTSFYLLYSLIFGYNCMVGGR